MKLYNLPTSGNCYKVRLFAALAQIPLDIVLVNFAEGEHKRPPLSEWNPLGELPILQDGQHIVRDSQAILVYLAGRCGGLAWWPAHAEGQAEIVQWLSFACNEIQHGLCALRLIREFGADLDKATAKPCAEHTLQLLESHLQNHDWLALERPTIADCAVYPYVLLAPEGGVDLAPWPAILAWMTRIKELPAWCAPG